MTIKFENSIQQLREYLDILSENNKIDESYWDELQARDQAAKDVFNKWTGNKPPKKPEDPIASAIPQGTPERPDIMPDNELPAGVRPGKDATAKPGDSGVGLNAIQDIPTGTTAAPKEISANISPEKFSTIPSKAPVAAFKNTATKTARVSDPIIKAAQQGLIAGGFLPPGSDDGIMGPKTQAAYAKFSSANPTQVKEHVSFSNIPELNRIISLARH